ncbi:la homolog, partial [Paramuricea clavata]
KGFPETTTLDELEEFFEDKGKCVNIKMRKTLGEIRTFKGSVFVEFETKEEADAFVARKDLKFKENELTCMTRDEYLKSKRGNRNSGMNTSSTDEDKTAVKKESQKGDEYPKGRVIHFSGAGDQTSREDIKEIFGVEGCTVKWVTFSKGDKEGFVRFTNDGGAEKSMKAVLEKNDNKLKLRGEETTLRVIEGDEEKDYWKKTREDMENFHKNKKGGKKPYRGNMKRGRQDNKTKEEPPVKQAKSDTQQ